MDIKGNPVPHATSMVQNLSPLLFSSLPIQETSNKPPFFFFFLIFRKLKHFRLSIGTGKKTSVHWHTYINTSTFPLISTFSFSRIKVFPFSLSLSFWAWTLTLPFQKNSLLYFMLVLWVCCASPSWAPSRQALESSISINKLPWVGGKDTICSMLILNNSLNVLYSASGIWALTWKSEVERQVLVREGGALNETGTRISPTSPSGVILNSENKCCGWAFSTRKTRILASSRNWLY